MSPEMRRIQVGSHGTVDLYYNDLYGLMVSIDKLQKEADTTQLTARQRHTLSRQPIEEDELLAALYRYLSSKTNSSVEKKSFAGKSPTAKALVPYFADFLSTETIPSFLPESQP